jgi:hypothetical protein
VGSWVLLVLLAMLSPESRQLLGWTDVNVCRDRSNGDTRHVHVQVQVHGMGWDGMVHAYACPSAVIARGRSAEEELASGNGLARRAASPSSRQMHCATRNSQRAVVC